ncbi:DUF262 domain-containing protein [Serinicoccus chungangensis]|uniref:DUF262 domain-containing protein n=1 Tax=Serinicoccus chungangensis TaxID=767452 RepID=UPI00111AC393|nr:DUF262 domain-containing protein [Serinicoccus chungangensis]
MAVLEHLLDFVSVDDLLGPHAPELRIPDFQRPYSWTPRVAAQLFTDIADASKERPDRPYIMGTLILLHRECEIHFEVVDGQQRLLTLHLLRTLLRGARAEQLEQGGTAIQLAYQELARKVRGLADGDKDRYREFLGAKGQVLRIVTDDEDEAFQFFDSQNFRGKALRPHDLLKAYHLREMADATTADQRAVVEQWEAAEENDLDRLFGTYLARIHQWSRNRPAHAFTMDDLDLFKGVGRATRRLPGAEYHRAAKAVLPGLQAWAGPATDEAALRDLKRAQHQLDAPIAAGRSFFEYAAFMLAESRRLDDELFKNTLHGLSEQDQIIFRWGARFRFCRELFVASALYFTNKYSEADLSEVGPRLFRWAYSLRLAYERLGWRSTDNYALGQGTELAGVKGLNLFATIRDSLDPSQLPLENVVTPQTVKSRNGDDERLAAVLREVG